jgi:hypothetical protein
MTAIYAIFILCATALSITFIVCDTNIKLEHEKGQNIRDAIRLYQMARPLLHPEIPSGTKT